MNPSEFQVHSVASNHNPIQRPPLHPALTIGGEKSLVHRAALWLVALTVLSGAFVFAEPAPVDLLTMALIFGLPTIGLTYLNAGLKVFLATWLVIAGCHVASVMISNQIGETFIHVAVSIYLFIAAVIFAAFVARRPKDHAQLILAAYTAAAAIAAVAGIMGYFNIIPGAGELFTKFGRASGPFKDPNVFGAFLIPAFLFAVHSVLNDRGARQFCMIAVCSALILGVLLSFSRGAWAAILIALFIYLALSFVTAKHHRQQLNIVAMVLVGGILVTLALTAAAQTDAIGNLLSERAQLTQAYDEGHEGRFGGQTKALDLIVSHPFGIGALEFATTYHSEEVHNVYLTMFLKSGWLGGGLFLILMVLTIVLGLRHAFRRTASQSLFIIAFAALAATILEGMLIDNDHWRHFYLLMAVVWGLMLSDRRILRQPRIIADISEQRMQLARIPNLPLQNKEPTRAPRIMARVPNQSVLYDVGGYSAHSYRGPRIVRARH